MPAPASSVRPDVPMETKLHAPGLRKGWVERPELTSYLARTATKLVLVGAPAGFGKTTLVAQWRASAMEHRAFAWVSLDRGDNDPGRLWSHIAHSLQRAALNSTATRYSGLFGPRPATSPERPCRSWSTS